MSVVLDSFSFFFGGTDGDDDGLQSNLLHLLFKYLRLFPHTVLAMAVRKYGMQFASLHCVPCLKNGSEFFSSAFHWFDSSCLYMGWLQSLPCVELTSAFVGCCLEYQWARTHIIYKSWSLQCTYSISHCSSKCFVCSASFAASWRVKKALDTSGSAHPEPPTSLSLTRFNSFEF